MYDDSEITIKVPSLTIDLPRLYLGIRLTVTFRYIFHACQVVELPSI